jgi:broad specificity phosphatase PhoE
MLKPGTTLYFVRHGETDWNVAQRYQGQTDTPLNAKGREQAARNGRVLKDVLGATKLATFEASPQLRASDTMRIIRRELGLPPEDFDRDDRLKEQHFGHWEGQLWTELPTIDPEGFAARKADTWNWRPRGGESYSDVQERVSAWLAEATGTMVVVSHGNISRAVRGMVLDKTVIPKLEVPQDKFLRLTARHAEWL